MHRPRWRHAQKHGRVPATAGIMSQSTSLLDRGFGDVSCSVDRSSANVTQQGTGSVRAAAAVNAPLAEAQPVQGVGLGPGQLFEGLDLAAAQPAEVVAQVIPIPVMQAQQPVAQAPHAAGAAEQDMRKQLRAARDYKKSMEPFLYQEGQPIRVSAPYPAPAPCAPQRTCASACKHGLLARRCICTITLLR